MENHLTLILDAGATLTRLGTSQDEAPRVCIPSIVARPRHNQSMVGSEYLPIESGFDAYKKRYTHKIDWPNQYGNIEDWDGMNK
jgi:actin-related protein